MKKIELVGILLVIIIIIGLFYFALHRSDTIGIKSPKEVYLALKTEAATTKDLNGMITVYRKYLSNAFFQENNIKVQAVPEDQKTQVFNTLQSRVVPVSDINVDKILEYITSDNAIVIAYTKNYVSAGTINLVKENGVWKINSSENWVGGEGK